MKGFFDTSVLIPVFYGDHIHHQASLRLFIQFDKSTGCCGAHSLIEVYSTLTRMPGKHRISGEQAMLFVDSICERLSIIALTSDEYIETLQLAAALGIVGGSLYDAMLAQCALKIPAAPDRARSGVGFAKKSFHAALERYRYSPSLLEHV